MSHNMNIWWTLPIGTLLLGLGIGYGVFSKDVTETTLEQPSLVLETHHEPLRVVNVALPPAPIEYQPQLSASLVNNKVVVTKQSTPAVQSPIEASSAVQSDQEPQAANIDSDSQLAQRFNQVLADMQEEQNKPTEVLHPQPLTRYPQWYQSLVPPMEFSEHIYSSKPNESRVRVNNQVVKEGELINDRMRIVKIEPQQVIIQLQQRQFSLPALSTW